MGLISEFRTSLENPSTPLSYPAEWLLDIFNGGRTDSGVRVSEMVALQVTTVWVCCEIKGGAIGALEPKIFQKLVNADGRLKRRISHEHDLWDILTLQPNPEMSSFTLRKAAQIHRMLWGNCYIEIQRDGAYRPVALWLRNPARTKPRRADKNFLIGDELIRAGELFYGTSEGTETVSPDPENPGGSGMSGERMISAADMIHIPGLTLDGRLGQSTIQLARNAIGLSLAAEKFGGKFFGNGAVGMGIFKYPSILSPEDFERTKRSLQEAWGGENNLRPMLFEAGIEFVPTSIKPNEGQFLETRQNQVIEICRIFNVPPHMAGVTEKSSRASTEQIGQEFVTFSLRPDLEAWQQECERKLLPTQTVGRNAGRKFGLFFDTWPLVVPAANDLRQFLAAMIQFGVFEPNDARERLLMNPLDGPESDATYLPINLAPAAAIYETPALPNAYDEPDAEGDSGEGSGNKKSKKKPKGVGGFQQQALRVYSRLFDDAFGRICARSECDLTSFQRAFLPVFLTMQDFADQEASAVLDVVAGPEDAADFENGRSFLSEYLKTMHYRCQNDRWGAADAESRKKIAARELQRAVKALAVECYRAAATRKAKQESKEQEVV